MWWRFAGPGMHNRSQDVVVLVTNTQLCPGIHTVHAFLNCAANSVTKTSLQYPSFNYLGYWASYIWMPEFTELMFWKMCSLNVKMWEASWDHINLTWQRWLFLVAEYILFTIGLQKKGNLLGWTSFALWMFIVQNVCPQTLKPFNRQKKEESGVSKTAES